VQYDQPNNLTLPLQQQYCYWRVGQARILFYLFSNPRQSQYWKSECWGH